MRKGARAGDTTAKLDALGVEWLCNVLLDGGTLLDAAAQAGVARSALARWIAAVPSRAQRMTEVRMQAAAAWDEKAEQVIKTAKSDFGLKKARELAHHYRWRAAKIAPAEYGDRQELVGAGGAPLIPESAPSAVVQLEGARRIAFILQRAEAITGNRAAAQAPGTPSAAPGGKR